MMTLNTQQIVNGLIVGDQIRWTNFYNSATNSNFSRPLGTPITVTYSFSSALQTYFNSSQYPGFRPLTDTERAVVRSAATQWDAASGLVLMEVAPGQGDIQIGMHGFNPSTTGYGYTPGSTFGGDIFFNTANSSSASIPAVTTELALHEFGHALGLKHPFETGYTGVTLPASDDKKSLTVMSYNYDKPAAQITSLGPYDVTAIQYLYGPDVPVSALFPSGYTAAGYLAANPDLLRWLGYNPQAANTHYLTAGVREGRQTSFDALRYLASYSDLAAGYGGTNEAGATEHYVAWGNAEGRDPKAWNPYAYLASNPDLQAAFGTDARSAELHYLLYGKAEGRTTSFDPWSYLAANLDLVVGLGTDTDKAALHYLQSGRAEGRKTTFDAATYMSLNPDIAAYAKGNATIAARHYAEFGWKEGRRTFSVPTVTRPGSAPAESFLGELQPAVPAPDPMPDVPAIMTASLATPPSLPTVTVPLTSPSEAAACSCPLCTGGAARAGQFAAYSPQDDLGQMAGSLFGSAPSSDSFTLASPTNQAISAMPGSIPGYTGGTSDLTLVRLAGASIGGFGLPILS